jgi:hypothetical protein
VRIHVAAFCRQMLTSMKYSVDFAVSEFSIMRFVQKSIMCAMNHTIFGATLST